MKATKPIPPDLAMPQGLSQAGQKAWRAITDLLFKEDAAGTGGCRMFYSPREWTERGEDYGHHSELVVVYDGADARRYFEYDWEDYKAIERMRKALDKIGMWSECGNCWNSAVYKKPETCPHCGQEMKGATK